MLQIQAVSRAANIKGSSKKKEIKRSNVVTVKPGENLSIIAKRYGMNYKKFMQWSGLNSTLIKAGQKITLPTDKMPAGKSLAYLASKHNMSLNELCRLNGITNPKTHVPRKGEEFIVYNKSKINSAQTSPKPTTPTPAKPQKPTTERPARPTAEPPARSTASLTAQKPASEVSAPTSRSSNVNNNANSNYSRDKFNNRIVNISDRMYA